MKPLHLSPGRLCLLALPLVAQLVLMGITAPARGSGRAEQDLSGGAQARTHEKARDVAMTMR